MTKKPAHFQGKKPLQHVVDAQVKGRITVESMHGSEVPGHIFSACDAVQELSIIFIVLYMVFFQLLSFTIFVTLFIAWIIWKTMRSALLAWSRLERLHRLTEQERWEIQHHREQEREELIALYQAKGFSGQLLEEVVEVLMADENRLLQVMLEEEMGLALETFEHPLKQACGAFIGALLSSIILGCCLLWCSFYPTIIITALLFIIASIIAAKKEKNRIGYAAIWNSAVFVVIVMTSYLLKT
jgi:hypothetical protein